MKLKEIVESINTTVQTTLKQPRFQSGRFYGLAKLVAIKQENEAYSAVIYENSGKEIDVTVDDNFPFQIYHRCLSISQVVAPANNQWGDGNNTIIETANMVAVVFAKSKIVELCQEDLASIITASFPSVIQITNINNTKVTTTSVNNDSFSVFNQEYKSTDYLLKPEDYYFSIGYTVETTFDKSCVDKCCN